ncbi:MAG: excinuclease ABC subunit C [Deltaproteobacteria bacterium]|nr:excinuclease ABC subunit C [Deltaproteobacteria bacterium]
MNLEKKVARAPLNPGVYLMKSAEGKIIYVGKAKNLRHRLKSYFQKTSDQSPKVQVLVSRIAELEWIITHTELEALMLECTLIKKHRPRYNVHLRDDKTYPYLRISVQEKWPQLSIVRRPKRDAALYFGPYMSAYSIRETLKLLTKIFPIRDCSLSKFSNRTRPCISYDIGICSAPCVGTISEEAYRKTVEDLVSFLRGKNKKIMSELKAKMSELSHQEKYEEAAQLRIEKGSMVKSLFFLCVREDFWGKKYFLLPVFKKRIRTFYILLSINIMTNNLFQMKLLFLCLCLKSAY